MERARETVVQEIASMVRAGIPVAVLGEPGMGVTTVLDDVCTAVGGRCVRTGGLRALAGSDGLVWQRALASLDEGPSRAETTSEELAAAVGAAVGSGLLVVDDAQWIGARALRSLFDRSTCRVLVGARASESATTGVRRAVVSAGGTVVQLDPLPDAVALELVSSAAPTLHDGAAREVVRRAAGNPGVLLALAGSGTVGPALSAALTAPGASEAPEVRFALAVLGLVGGSVDADVLEVEPGRLTASGSVVAEAGRLRLRHEILGSAAYDTLGPAERRRAHLVVARSSSDAVVEATHLLHAGEVDRALSVAKAAAGDGPVPRRIDALALAAACAEGVEQAQLLAEAVRTALDGGLRARADAMAAELEHHDHVDASGLALVAEARALVGRSSALALSRRALAELDGDDRLAATATLASVWPSWVPCEGRGHPPVRRSERDPDVVVAARSAAALFGAEHRALDPVSELPASAATISMLLGAETDPLGSRRDEPGPSAELARLIVSQHLAGDTDAVGSRLATLLDELDVTVERQLCTAHHAVCLADSGRTGAAAAALELADQADRTPVGAAALRWAAAEVAYSSGRLRAARALVEELLDGVGRVPVALFDALTLLVGCWTVVESEGELGSFGSAPFELDDVARGDWPLLAAVRAEVAAVRSCVEDVEADARAQAFDAAADAWRGRQLRAELRCRWAAADARLDGGGRAQAVGDLQEIEALAGEIGLRQLVARCRSSLRAVGVRTRPSRGAGRGGLSAREVEVMELVRLGFTTKEAASTLGVATSTIDTQVESAMRKLGARTRVQAAAICARSDR